MNPTILSFVLFFLSLNVMGQQTVVKGRVVDANSVNPVAGVLVEIQSSAFQTSTDNDGRFLFDQNNLPLGEQVLVLNKPGYTIHRIPITIQFGNTINLDPIMLEIDRIELEKQIGTIPLSDSQLDLDEGTSYTISGLLQSSKDVFLKAAAYDFSSTFFKPRGLDNSNGKVLINGIEMNKLFNGRPQWSNWGGLNDLQRNRTFSMGLKANELTFGDIAGTTNIEMRASSYPRGGRISYAVANRSYTGRVMASYNSGITKNNWAYSFLVSRRYGDHGFVDGTLYSANSILVAVEKKFNFDHSLNILSFYTPAKRGRSTAITEEVMNLKGRRYNPNWGYQDGKPRNSSIRSVEEPVIMLNHFWNISETTMINTNICYQFGRVGTTRLDYGSNRNPAGNYYQRLPSYFLRNENPTAYDFRLAYSAEQEFIKNGQLDWESLYRANSVTSEGNSIYVIQEDVTQDSSLTINTILKATISDGFILNTALNYKRLKSQNYSELNDLLGGQGYLDIDPFGDDPVESQSDLKNMDRVVKQGERYKYNYELNATLVSAFIQGQFKYRSVDFFLAILGSYQSYQRTGLYQNGYFPKGNRSFGNSEAVNFSNIGIKGGILYKLSGRHFIEMNAGVLTKAPNLRNSFVNARQNNDIVEGLVSEKIQLADLSYIYRTPGIKARLSGFYSVLRDQTEIGFFFTQNALGNSESTAFVQEITTGIGKRNLGIELGIEAQFLPTFTIKAAASVGEYSYTNDPLLYLAGDDFDDPDTPELDGNDIFSQGIRPVSLKNYHVPGGPERAFQIGMEYRDPEFWWIGVSGNYFSNAFIDVSNLRRTPDFYTDSDGLPYNDYNEDIAKELLRQEELDDYILLNVVGGKSWKWKDYYIGFFTSINNVFNVEYRNGGFEDSRRTSYRQQLEEQNRPYGPLFGNRYFFGLGTTYYINAYLRF